MYLFTRIQPLVVMVIASLGFEYSFLKPERYLAFASLIILLALLGAIVMLRSTNWFEQLVMIAPAFSVLLSASVVLFLIELPWLRHVVVIALGTSLWIYYEEVYRFIYEPARYHTHSLEHLGTYLALLALVGGLAGMFALRVFLDLRLLYLLPLTLLTALLNTFVLFTIQPQLRSVSWLLVVLYTVLITELSWAAQYLPTQYWVNSLVVVIPFYIAVSITRLEMSNTLTKQLLGRHLVAGSVLLFLVLATAQWVV